MLIILNLIATVPGYPLVSRSPRDLILNPVTPQRRREPGRTPSASSHTSRTLRLTERRAKWQVSWGFRDRPVDGLGAETGENRSPEALSYPSGGCHLPELGLNPFLDSTGVLSSAGKDGGCCRDGDHHWGGAAASLADRGQAADPRRVERAGGEVRGCGAAARCEPRFVVAVAGCAAARCAGDGGGDLHAGARRAGTARPPPLGTAAAVASALDPDVEYDTRVEILLPDGTALRVPTTIGTAALRRVLAALRG